MKETNYWKEENKNKANSKLPSCSAKDYYQPILNKVSTKIKAEDSYFLPKYCSSNSIYADIFVNHFDRSFAIQHLGVCDIDCGFSIEISKGYKICVELDPIWMSKGLVIVSEKSFFPNDLDKIKITVYNMGNKQVVINHKDKIARIWVEPVYFFEWT